MNGLQWWHVAVVVIVAVLLFGSKRLPTAARGIGQSLRILKSEVKAMKDEEKSAPSGESARTDGRVPVSAPARTGHGVITVEGRPATDVRS
jgi:sec-independent protein translocase protein TatA